MSHGTARAAIIVLAALTVPACSWIGGGSTSLRIESRTGPEVLEPRYTTALYRYEDPNSLEVYLTDLPMNRLLEAAEGQLSEPLPPGNLARVSVFLNPRAGYTPIAFESANFAVTHIVVSGEVYGVYTGAGFILPSSTPGDDTFSGRTSGANLKLAGFTDGFKDLLGPSEMSGAIAATRDDARSERLGALVSAMSRYARVAQAEHAEKPAPPAPESKPETPSGETAKPAAEAAPPATPPAPAAEPAPGAPRG